MIDLPAWTPTEIIWMRALFGASLLVWTLPITGGSTTVPVGVAKWVDPSPLLDHRWMKYAVPLLLPLFVSGVAQPVPAVLLALLYILAITVRSSDGAVSHGHHMAAIVLTAMAAAEIADRLTRTFDLSWEVDARTAPGFAVQAVLALYFSAGASKVIMSGGTWIAQTPRLELAMLAKTYQRVDSDPTDRTVRFAEFFRRHPTIVRVAAGLGLLVEVLAPLGLLHPTALMATGVALIALHLFNGLFLRLPFPANQAVVVIFLVLFSVDLG